jgi:hypothetical protein
LDKRLLAQSEENDGSTVLNFYDKFSAGSGSGTKFYLDPDLDLESNPDLKLDSISDPDPNNNFGSYRSGSPTL